jgi:hypothetical protein
VEESLTASRESHAAAGLTSLRARLSKFLIRENEEQTRHSFLLFPLKPATPPHFSTSPRGGKSSRLGRSLLVGNDRYLGSWARWIEAEIGRETEGSCCFFSFPLFCSLVWAIYFVLKLLLHLTAALEPDSRRFAHSDQEYLIPALAQGGRVGAGGPSHAHTEQLNCWKACHLLCWLQSSCSNTAYERC